MKSLLFLPELCIIIGSIAILFDFTGITSIIFRALFIILELYRNKKIGRFTHDIRPILLGQIIILFLIYYKNTKASIGVIIFQCIYLIYENYKSFKNSF